MLCGENNQWKTSVEKKHEDADGAFESGKTLFRQESPFQTITVAEQNGCRYLLFGANQEQETACFMKDPDFPVFEYPCLMLPALALKPDAKSLLLAGLGGGYLPGLLQRHRPDIAVTVVEIDPAIPRIAKEYFGFAEGGSVRVAVADGRDFLEREETRYDHIWLDAYDGEYIPARLATVEFLRLCRDRLKTRGVLVQNVHPDNPLYAAHQATMTEVFGYYYNVRGSRGANAALMAQKDVPRPSSARGAFAKGFTIHGAQMGHVNLRAELRKATLDSHTDRFAVLKDEDC